MDCAHQRICEEAQEHQPAVHFLIQMGNQDVQEWDEHIEHQKATCESSRYRLNRP